MTAEMCDEASLSKKNANEKNMKASDISRFTTKSPESTIAVLTQRIQQWQRAMSA